MAFHAIPPADLELLRKFDTPTICNVIELFDHRPHTAGYMDQRIQACFPKLPPMVGYAATATFRSAAPPRAGDVYAGIADQVASFAELPGPPVVVFQDLDNPVASAVAHACAEFAAAEAVVLDYLKGGKVDLKGFATAHKECRDRIAQLGRKLKSR